MHHDPTISFRHYARSLATALICASACFTPGSPMIGATEVSMSSDGSSGQSSGPTPADSTESTSSTGAMDGASSSSTSGPAATTDEGGTTTESRPSCNEVTDLVDFGPAMPMPGVNTSGPEDSAWLSPDELTIWVSTERPEGIGGYDIFRGERDDGSAAFGALTPIAAVNTAFVEREPELTADTLTLYCVSNAPSSAGGLDIMVSTRDSTLADFGTPAPVSNINTASHEASPCIDADGTELYFASNRAGSYDLYRAQLGAGGSFGAPVVIGELSPGDAEDGAPVISADGLTIFFQSDRDDPLYDVYVATRSTRDDGFGEPVALGESVNTSATEWPIWLSNDGCRLVFGSTRPEGEGGYDLWIAEREP
jgi:hypothetical protein